MGEAKRRKDRQKALLDARNVRSKVFAEARQATVGFGFIYPQDQSRLPRILGSGVCIHTSGIALTARHVVLDLEAASLRHKRLGEEAVPSVFIPGTPQLEMTPKEDGSTDTTFSQNYTAARIENLQVNKAHDIAVVRVGGDIPEISAMRVNYDLEPVEGDPVATCGWPYGVELHQRKGLLSSFLVGTVSAVLPHPKVPARARVHYLMQLPVNPGNSGGPVFDPDTGEVFGVVSSRYEPGGIPAGLSIIIPAFHAEPIVATLRSTSTTS